ncbi:MAG: ABC transporter permease [Thermoanaerobaculia bacterium]|nr:ABC transporter permease [Thermoanaerobaculia bacterium]
MLDALLQAIPLAVVASVPLLLAVQGELVVQRSGIINLGLEGMLLAGAFGAALGGVAGGIAGAVIVALIFGWLVIVLGADQIVTGTAINLLVLGITGFAWRELSVAQPPRLASDLITPFAWIIVPLILAVVLWNTTLGLRLRATGENAEAVRAAGVSTALHRWIALAIEAVLAGLGGAHLALVLSSGFAENMTAGRGYIALAVVIFGRWNVRGALLGSAIFGLAVAFQYALQAANKGVPYHLLLAAPYVVTLLLLFGVAGKVRAPEGLGR